MTTEPRRSQPAVEASTPYRWPYDGPINPAHSALVICGTGPEWSERTPLDGVAEASVRLLRIVAARTGMVTLLLQHDRPSDRPVALPAEPTSTVLEPVGDEISVASAGLDGFYGSNLDPLLRRHGRTHLLICGRALETTVHSTLRRANDRGYECLTVADACATINHRLRHQSLSSIEMSGGIFGAVGSTDAVVAALNEAVHEISEPPYHGAGPTEANADPHTPLARMSTP